MTDSAAEHTGALGLDLKHEPLPADTVVLGNPSTAVRELEDLAGCGVGIWEMTPGTATDTEAEEVFVVLSGKARLVFLDDGSTLDVATGDVVRLRQGQRTSWTVTETLRKIYFAGQ
ncbi:cupin domain-containing protein [Arthrobacter sp. I3]|jgi:uncharacterized cupin superfamily protein|uniref:cupin domain-containing protein n=1 Tax=Arthrobacter sp. I3 TaxID=218158 RepID=UPI000481E0E1|nr:cupin domain-containing protein [Arthrobacter sp. I3]